MAGWFDDQGIDGYQPMAVDAAGGADAGGGGDINAAGAGSDPFAYTQGSLLTPWTKKFEWNGGTAGAYTPPELSAFNFADAPSISVPRIEAMSLQERPDFAFQFNQDEDPSYQFRLKEGQRALENSAAARGTLLTGGTAKAIQNYGQQAASQEYGNSFNRALQTYGTNLNKEFGTFDRNWGSRLGAGQANIQAAIGEGNLKLGAWDRNYGKARTQWQDSADAAMRAASAGSANSAASFNQAMALYNMEKDDFRTNQDRQYSMLMGGANLGLGAAGALGGYGGQAGANAGSIYGQQGNAAASGRIGASNAWGSALGNAGNTAMGLYGMYQAQGYGRPGGQYSGAPSGGAGYYA
jgi:hypothetical protein